MIRRALLASAVLSAATVVAPAHAEPAPAPAPVEHQGFLGWHPTGDVAYVTLLDATNKPAGLRVCRSDGSDVPAAWPQNVTIGAGVLCADVTDAAVGQPVAVWAMAELAGHKPLKASPWGLKVELATDGTRHAITVSDGPDKKLALPVVESATPLKLGEVLWRKDGAATAIALDATTKPAAGTPSPRVVVVADVHMLLTGGAAGRKVAQAKEKDALALMKKRDWSGAGRVLDDALAADASYAPAHYARAAAEAQGGIGRTAMIENLTWLKSAAATDATAKKLLEQAKRDAAFDAWCGEPELRELLGLPAVGTMDVPTRLTERTATWTLQGATCKNPWLTLVFGKGKADKQGRVTGPGTLELAESCKGKKSKTKQPFTWAQTAAGPFSITTKAADAGALQVPASSTIVLDETHQQLKLQPEGADAVGTFEPGTALIDDSVL